MRLSLLTLLPLLGALPLRADLIAVESARFPFCLVGESVKVSVGKQLSMVEGEYDFKYVPRFDRADRSDRIAFRYAAFAPKEADSLETLIEITQIKLRVGTVEFAPEDFAFVEEDAGASLQIAPEDARGVIFTFRIPRALLHQQCTLHISHYQPHYRFGGKKVSAWLPLLPDFEALKNEFLYSRVDFTVEFEAVDAVRLHRLSANESVVQETPQRVQVHPIHWENIAVEVEEPARS
ncbi:MAG: hypothetical protein ABSG50_02640 [Opitutaceae bacterium]|jgi:hypothetical protein